MKRIDVVILTFNHEKYIEECLKSVVSQKGSFDLRIMVFDDQSSDRTVGIVQKFAGRDERINLFVNEERLTLHYNLKQAMSYISGDYFAFCEGDDYWIDEYKLQKQLEFMEVNSDCAMCYNNLIYYNESTNEYQLNQTQMRMGKSVIGIEEIILDYTIKNFSTCFYRNILEDISFRMFEEPLMGDWLFHIEYAQHGKIGVLRQPMSVYRLHGNGLWSSLSVGDKLRVHIQIAKDYNKIYSYKYDGLFTEIIKKLEDVLGNLGESKENENLVAILSAKLGKEICFTRHD